MITLMHTIFMCILALHDKLLHNFVMIHKTYMWSIALCMVRTYSVNITIMYSLLYIVCVIVGRKMTQVNGADATDYVFRFWLLLTRYQPTYHRQISDSGRQLVLAWLCV